MPQRKPLSPEAVASALRSLSEWSIVEGKLVREYRFPDFSRAFAFMAGAATVAEKLDHHPEWTNVYGRVSVTLWTHTEGAVTEMDVELASRMEAIAGGLLR
ncbi:MAG TPA: 4a-hydroxytetrahydrobiopterin dehydratase [Bryobacteraceae bacterium]|nr:4a-hydroxytetrahydrobiopterin dehydratase [Bryobacteraceae bacterium]